MGLWLLQESLRTWRAEAVAARRCWPRPRTPPPFAALVIDPDDPAFLPPGDMPARIAAYCARTGQRPSRGTGRGRALHPGEPRARPTGARSRDAARLSGRHVEVVHIVGGGARNALLCQLTADACGLPVVAGPVEATASATCWSQARAHGLTADPRELVRRTQELTVYRPRGDDAAWDRAAQRIGLS